MDFGLQFFPSVGPEQVPADRYFDDLLRFVELGERLGFVHARIVEHYFHPYGGYSPNPIVFLSAAAQRTQRMRLITGAVLPVFNHPLKLAGEIGMLDGISKGRLEVGFARAFLPHEFERFGVPLDESRDRFDEGLEIVRKLLEEEEVAFEGRFHRFGPTTSLPRPTQRPRPPFWIAALSTDVSFVNAGRLGHHVMAIPLAGAEMKRLIALYRRAWRDAGHPGEGRVMLAFHLFCHRDGRRAREIARGPMERFMQTLQDAGRSWSGGLTSPAYPRYAELFARLEQATFDGMIEHGVAWIGSPEEIAAQIEGYTADAGPFEVASVQAIFNDLAYEDAYRSLELFAREVMPRFAGRSV
jgi:alkanesulfonate monooxygenase SsuD/methylene tetrahydromethanopterin reductase-like flavin-dependent oxidoreductase (luciferase family)